MQILCFLGSGITSWENDLYDLVSIKGMFYNCKSLTKFEAACPNLEKTEATSWNARTYGPFENCTALTTINFTEEMPNLKSIAWLCNNCVKLSTIDLSKFANVTHAFYAFNLTKSLTMDVELNMPNVVETYRMFENSKIHSFKGRCDVLYGTWEMFSINDNLRWLEFDGPNLTDTSWFCTACPNLSRVTANFPSLKNGYSMFQECTGLEDFEADLPSLLSGELMFNRCILNLQSIQRIANSLQDVNNIEVPESESNWLTKKICLGINAELQNNDELNTALEIIRSKGWTVEEQYNAKQTA